MVLTADQLQAIDRHLRKENWLLNENLIAELRDHYVAGIEDRISMGVSFERALLAIHADFGGRKGLLAMEETYQHSKYQLYRKFTWETIQSFIEGPRWPMLVIVTGLLYWLNTDLGYPNMLSIIISGFRQVVTISAIINVAGVVLNAYVNSRNAGGAVSRPMSVVFITLYFLARMLAEIYKHSLSTDSFFMSDLYQLMIETFIDALCILYCFASVMNLKTYLGKPKPNPLTNA